jgi:hypothetical protein
MPPMEALADSRNAHAATSAPIPSRVQAASRSVADDLYRPVALIILAAVVYALLVL